MCIRDSNKALINRGSITFWLDDEAIQAWYERNMAGFNEQMKENLSFTPDELKTLFRGNPLRNERQPDALRQ